MADKDLKVQNEGALQREPRRRHVDTMRPAVDIVENSQGLTLYADMPGLEQDDLQVQIDKGVLTLEGTPKQEPKGNAVHEEFSVRPYYRQFQLPEQIDSDKAQAELKNGVLTLNLPKVEAAQPRRIQVNAS